MTNNRGKIGYYVHLHAERYNTLGIHRFSGQNNCIQVYKKQKERIQKKANSLTSGLSKNQKQELERTIGSIFNPSLSKNNEEEKIYQDYLKELEKLMQEQFGSAVGKITRSGNIESTKIINEIKEIRDKLMKVTTINKSSTVDQAKKSLEVSFENIQKLAQKGILSQQEYDKIIMEKNIIMNKLGNKKGLIGNSSLINQINAFLKRNKYNQVLTEQKGELAEYAVALALAKMDGMALEEATKIIKEGAIKVGQERSSVQLDLNNFAYSSDLANHNFKNYNKENNILTSIMETQNKVDVRLQVGKAKIEASVKNYNLYDKWSSDIHLLSGSSLLYLLQDENSSFVTHYMNTIVEHKDNTAVTHLVLARTIAKLTVFLKALTGGTFGKGKTTANLFIVNANNITGSKGGRSVYVFDMNDVFNAYYNKINSISIKTEQGDFNSIKLKNDYELTPEKRISNILFEMHQQKISVGIKKVPLKT